MAHFAEIDENSVVIRVLVVPDEQEHRGQEFLRDDLQLGGRWIQTSFNNQIRKQYAGVGYSYNPVEDIFVAPQPFLSWALDENYDWKAPIPQPNEGSWYWNEEKQRWIEFPSIGDTRIAVLGDE